MGIFHKIKLGIQRFFARNNVGFVSEQKAFGNEAENIFSSQIERMLPGCSIKSNVIVSLPVGTCEIDNLVQYKNKLFIIEIKNWKGDIIQNGDEFISRKQDKYTNEIHIKSVKSPFAQVKRQIKLLKQLTDSNPWINPIVYFNNTDNIHADKTVAWFTDIHGVIDYIVNGGNESYYKEIKKCFDRCREADLIYSSVLYGKRNCHCLIDDSSIKRICNGVSASDIIKIDVLHHFSYDTIKIYMRNGQTLSTTVENGILTAIDTMGNQNTYSLCKIETILLGKR